MSKPRAEQHTPLLLGLGDGPAIASNDSEVSELTLLATAGVTAKGRRVRGGAQATMEWAREQAAMALARKQSEQEEIVLQKVLPLWTDEHRGVPNPMIRSGLFGTKTSGERVFCKGEAIASLSNFTILYRGEELLQDDLSVWMSLMNMARKQRIGDAIFFSGYQLLKDLGWRMHTDSYVRAKESISRLKANELKIQIRTGEAGYAGSLIREYAWDGKDPEAGNKWMVRFEPMIAELFRDDTVTLVEWAQRKLIGTRATLTLYLHSYYTSHREPLPITIQKLHELCRSEEKHMKSFKVRVRNSLERLVEIGTLSTYQITGDLVSVKKAPSRFLSVRNAAPKALA